MIDEIENENPAEGEEVNEAAETTAPTETTECIETTEVKKKFVFAKDRRQAITAIVVMVIFLLNTARMVVSYAKEQEISTAQSLKITPTQAQPVMIKQSKAQKTIKKK